MPPLSEGAVELPMSHVSVRVAWHDTDWTGRVCASPETNHACTILKNVKENKDPEAEAAGCWPAMDRDRRAAAVRYRARRVHAHQGVHARADARLRVEQEGSARAFRADAAADAAVQPRGHAVPVGHAAMSTARYTEPWGISVDEGLEERAQELMTFTRHLDSGPPQPARAARLVLLGAPTSEIARASLREGRAARRGARARRALSDRRGLRRRRRSRRRVGVLRGRASCGRSCGSAESRTRSGPTFEDGFLLPYHQLLADPALQGADLEPFVARAPR